MTDEQMFLKIAEVAKALGISRGYTYDMIRRGQLPAVRFEGRGDRDVIRVPRRALEALIEQATAKSGNGNGSEK